MARSWFCSCEAVVLRMLAGFARRRLLPLVKRTWQETPRRHRQEEAAGFASYVSSCGTLEQESDWDLGQATTLHFPPLTTATDHSFHIHRASAGFTPLSAISLCLGLWFAESASRALRGPRTTGPVKQLTP